MRLWPVAMLLLTSACTAGSMPGLVILDEGARDRGYEIVVDDQVMAPVLPVEAEGRLHVYTDLGDVMELEVGPGELVRIDTDGQATLVDRAEVGWDVDPHSALVEGEPDALEQLAGTLEHLTTTVNGDTLEVEGPEALLELAWAPRLHGLYAVWTLELEDVSAGADAGSVTAPAAPGSFGATGVPGSAGGASTSTNGGLGAFLAGLLGGSDASARGRAQGSVMALPTDGLDRRPYVGFYMMEGKEVALSLDGQVRHGTHDGRPIASWSLGSSGEPVVMLGARTLRVERVQMPITGEDR